MKNYAVLLFILFSNLLSGCDNSTANDTATQPQKAVTAQKQVKVEAKKQPIIQEQVKVNPENDLKPSQQEPEENPELSKQAQDQQVLDLSVPIKETTKSGSIPSAEKRDYLPDLFADKKKQKNNSLQLDGKIIRREEEEIGKDRVVDGVGIDFKMKP